MPAMATCPQTTLNPPLWMTSAALAEFKDNCRSIQGSPSLLENYARSGTLTFVKYSAKASMAWEKLIDCASFG